jgi:hypothetical protein
MHVVKTKQDFIDKYPYRGEPKNFPEKYPCLLKFEEVGGGIMGSYTNMYATYAPEGVDFDTFVKCVSPYWQEIEA